MAQESASDWIKSCVDERRQALNGSSKPSEHIGLEDPRWGLAFSGGGIRSATICLGITKALAASGNLLRFDLLSTVSGGGYTGAMLGRLASRCPDAAALRRTVAALGSTGAPRPTWMQWWLRANGRYLIPSGWADSVFAAALYMRNLLAVHVELALMAALVGCGLTGVLLLAWGVRADLPADTGLFSLRWLDDGLAGSFVPVPLLLLGILVLPALVFALSYWALSSRIRPLPVLQNIAMWSVGAVVLVVVGLPLIVPAASAVGAGLRSALFAVALLTALVWIAAWLAAARSDKLERQGSVDQRQRLTLRLAFTLNLAAGILAAAALDRAAWWLAFEVEAPGVTGLTLAMVVAVLRAILPKADQLVAGRLSTAALLALASAFGWLLAFAVAAFWVSLVYRVVLGAVYENVGPGMSGLQSMLPAAGIEFLARWLTLDGPINLWRGVLVLPVMAAPPLLYLVLTRRNFEFLNSSSLHTFYRARLVRSYLGAANPARFSSDPQTLPLGAATVMPEEPATGYKPREVGEVLADDDIPMEQYAPHLRGAPVHLINVCVNQTTDPRGGLHNRDRRGLPLTVGPKQSMRVGLRPWHRQDNAQSALTLGQWTAISGAAFAPGLGSATRGGVSVLATLAGLRLGYWWDGLPDAAGRPQRWKQGGLLDEFTASFPGTEMRQAYLTDGGHAENTGAYPLLVERCQLIVVADCGADPDYVFDDLENLIRRARIDLDTDIVMLERAATAPESVAGVPLAAFGSLEDLKSPKHEARIAIATVRYPDAPAGTMLIVKPTTWSSMSADLANYHRRHTDFPQQPTTDQFFDEEQWESYYKLGTELGHALAVALPPNLGSMTQYFVEPPLARGIAGGQPVAAGPARLAARFLEKPGKTTVQVGALVTAGLAVWQGAEAIGARHDSRLRDEQKALEELTGLWGKLPAVRQEAQLIPAALASSGPAVASSEPQGSTGKRQEPAPGVSFEQAANALAAALARTADTLCTDVTDKENWFWRSQAAQRIHVDALLACRSLTPPRAPACQALIGSPSCLAFDETKLRGACAPRYWAYNFQAADGDPVCASPQAARRLAMAAKSEEEALGLTNDPASTMAPASAPVSASAPVPASAPAPEPAASTVSSTASPASTASAASSSAVAEEGACNGFTIYIQIFGNEWRDDARDLRTPLRAAGASVPPIEDVLATSRSRGRVAPLPVEQAEVRAAPSPAAGMSACMRRLERELAPRYGAVRRLEIPSRLWPKPNVLEVWLPPRAPIKNRSER